MLNAISGRKISEKIKENLKEEFSLMKKKVVFSIVYVGKDPVIDNFIRYKKSFGEDVGVQVQVHNFNELISFSDLKKEIEKINNSSDAVIVQLPLPEHLDTQEVLNLVPLKQDIDLLSDDAKNVFRAGKTDMFPPVTGAMILSLEEKDFSVKNSKNVLLGYGDLVGKPFGAWLDIQATSYEIITKETDDSDRKKFLAEADLVVCGAGVPGLLKAEDIKEGVFLLDGGTSEVGKKIRGDVDPSCYEKASFYTPVPGGIGPITIAVLYQNILKSIKKYD